MYRRWEFGEGRGGLRRKGGGVGGEVGFFRAIDNNEKNIAGRLPENSRNSFIDLQSKRQTKKLVFSLNAEMLYFD